MQNKTPTPLEEQGCDYTVLRLVPVTMGRANSTKSSIRTGQAPGKAREKFSDYTPLVVTGGTFTITFTFAPTQSQLQPGFLN